MSNSNNAQSRSLWIGDIEYWMDEVFIIKIFEAYGINYFLNENYKKQMLKI